MICQHDPQWLAYTNPVDVNSDQFCVFCELERLKITNDLFLSERQELRGMFPACLDPYGPELVDAVRQELERLQKIESIAADFGHHDAVLAGDETGWPENIMDLHADAYIRLVSTCREAVEKGRAT